MKLIKNFPRGERLVSMVVHKDHIYVATTKRIFRLEEDVLKPLQIKQGAEALKK